MKLKKNAPKYRIYNLINVNTYSGNVNEIITFDEKLIYSKAKIKNINKSENVKKYINSNEQEKEYLNEILNTYKNMYNITKLNLIASILITLIIAGLFVVIAITAAIYL